jgi:hypothetical protein
VHQPAGKAGISATDRLVFLDRGLLVFVGRGAVFEVNCDMTPLIVS